MVPGIKIRAGLQQRCPLTPAFLLLVLRRSRFYFNVRVNHALKDKQNANPLLLEVSGIVDEPVSERRLP
jgi:hypothetical protein